MKTKYFIQADHPILKRIDETIVDHKIALDFISDLEGMGYENIKVTVKEVPDGQS